MTFKDKKEFWGMLGKSIPNEIEKFYAVTLINRITNTRIVIQELFYNDEDVKDYYENSKDKTFIMTDYRKLYNWDWEHANLLMEELEME